MIGSRFTSSKTECQEMLEETAFPREAISYGKPSTITNICSDAMRNNGHWIRSGNDLNSVTGNATGSPSNNENTILGRYGDREKTCDQEKPYSFVRLSTSNFFSSALSAWT